ncbi:DNA helicase [Anaeramoeba flamelloides]|uniref:DNA helicase n=1 Tax=Anaeramoeba flamelloides TaxID=1746091 RepID=A0ABQ8XA60_9EUKA|nr:DNA helicase [Anaeramoeba flamelloides]
MKASGNGRIGQQSKDQKKDNTGEMSQGVRGLGALGVRELTYKLTLANFIASHNKPIFFVYNEQQQRIKPNDGGKWGNLTKSNEEAQEIERCP